MKSFNEKVQDLEKDQKDSRHIHKLIKAAKAIQHSGYKHFVRMSEKVRGK